MASLVVVSGKSRGYFFLLEERTMIVGRDEVCDIQVMGNLISRRHVQIRFEPQGKTFLATDLQSTNGVFVNGQQISHEVRIQDGDTITIGESKLFFTSEDFLDRDAAIAHLKYRGEGGRSTLIQ